VHRGRRRRGCWRSNVSPVITFYADAKRKVPDGVPVSHPRPRHQVHCHLRRCIHRHRRLDHQDAGAGTAGERDRRALRRNDPPGTPRPPLDHQPTTRRSRPACVRAPPQPSPTAPHPRPGRSLTTPPLPRTNRDPRDPTTRPPRRARPRVSAGRMTWDDFLAPTRRVQRRSRGVRHPARENGQVSIDSEAARRRDGPPVAGENGFDVRPRRRAGGSSRTARRGRPAQRAGSP